MHGFIWCPHCGQPHALSAQVCPSSGQPLPGRKGVQPEPKRRALPRPNQVDGERADRDRNRAQVNQLIGTVIDGRYRLSAVIGRGGFGTVFAAENLRFGGRVALKLLDQCDERTIKRFNQEARIAGTVLHPNVCQVFDFGWVKDRPYCVMELLTGETLSERIKRKEAMSVVAAVDIIIQVLGGLFAAHQAGVVHRDVKPQNVFMSHRQGCAPAVKLLDFGLAKALAPDSGAKAKASLTATMPGRVVGTVAYMSPEQVVGESIDRRSDLFSCAVVLFEALTGVLPWTGDSPAALATSILRDPPLSLRRRRPDAPAALEGILMRALTKDRTKRPQTAYEFLRALSMVQPAAGGVPTPSISVLEDDGDDDSTELASRPPVSRPDVERDEATTTTTMNVGPISSTPPSSGIPSSALPRVYSVVPPSYSSVPPRRRGALESSVPSSAGRRRTSDT